MFRKISTIIVVILAIVALIFVGLRVSGLTPYYIETDSMEPEYKVGTLVYVKQVNFDSLKKGDVISFVRESNSIGTHRIIEINGEYACTKGDNNEYPDASLVYPENLLGKVVFKIPYLGYVSERLTKIFN